jgi:hypothetical protein
MVDAFATVEDLEARLNRTFAEGAESDWITTLLGSASTYLRRVIGQLVWPQTTSTYTDYPTEGRVDLPQWPVIAVTSVQRAAVDVTFTYRPGYLTIWHTALPNNSFDSRVPNVDQPVDITYTWGYATPPDDLVDLTCVLVSTALLTLESNIGLTAGGLSSAAIDDFKIAWADAGAQSGMVLPQITIDSLRARYGKGDYSIVTTV